MSALPLRRYRVVVIEWLSHKAVIEATSVEDAEAKARTAWANNVEHDMFVFEDSDIESVSVEEIPE